LIAGSARPRANHADQFTLAPGMGVHIPTNTLHWVQNGNNVSISVSINYHSWAIA
jgi:hypothetical protein